MCMAALYSSYVRRSGRLCGQFSTISDGVVPTFFLQPLGGDLLIQQKSGGVKPAGLARRQGVADDGQPGTVGLRVLLKNL